MRRWWRTVHPRECGERRTGRWASSGSRGSSPRVRGTRSCRRSRSSPGRFIPASAGNARRQGVLVTDHAVHPRECGERARLADVHRVPAGSSPRVRGTLRPPRPLGHRRRFIPASAGNASPRPAQQRAVSVHPRECGERQPSTSSTARSVGSSPRVRGTHLYYGLCVGICRFIPASAGNAGPEASIRTGLTVHPRECGERLHLGRQSPASVGSSPRVRGTLVVSLAAPVGGRFIPASAGNALPLIP